MEESQKGTPVPPPKGVHPLWDRWPGLIPLMGTPTFIVLVFLGSTVLLSALVNEYRDWRPFAFLASPALAAETPAIDRCATPPCNVGLGGGFNGEYGVLVGSDAQPVVTFRDSEQRDIVYVDQAGRVVPAAGVEFDVAMDTFCSYRSTGASASKRAQAEKLLAMANAKLEVAERLTRQTVNSYVCPPGHRADRSDCLILRPGETLVLAQLGPTTPTTNAVPTIPPGDFYRGPLEWGTDRTLDLVHKP